MKQLILTCVLLLAAACSAPSTPTPTVEVIPNPPISTPSQVTLSLSDPFTDEVVNVIFELPENWPITAGLSNLRIVVIPTLKPLGEGNPTPSESVSQAVGTPAETLTVNGREVFMAIGGAAPNSPLSLAVTLPDRNYFLQINVLQIFEGTAADYREALQRIIASARLSS
ncbi:MAG: hypothetical protein CUN49_05110 [Candidatus Thermofonsia Clade 1 bacterium]|nr:MAG: hypothetical protein CUN49_05110 [Candidatus Thermofonsia Clade 1 bacterium]